MSIILPSYQFMISIHALREEGDKRSSVLDQSAPVISIHALREEGDRDSSSLSSLIQYFYPRPPRGGRRMSRSDFINEAVFLSTPSARRATT